jgi:hypothetical protein
MCLLVQAKTLHLLLQVLDPEDVVTILPLNLVIIYQSTQHNIIGDLNPSILFRIIVLLIL